MSLPEGVTTCLLTYGPITNTLGTPAESITVAVVADRTVVHAASGRTLFKSTETFTADGTGVVRVPVPHVNQAGFRDQQQNTLTHWYYTVSLTARFPNGGQEFDRKQFQPLVDQTTVDADLLPSDGKVTPGVTVPTATVTSVDGQTGAVSLGPSYGDAAVAGRISNTATATGAALNASFASVVQVVADGTDKTGEINAALASLPGRRKTVRLVGGFRVTDTLVVHSNTTLDAVDASVTLADGTNKNLLGNRSAYTPQRTTTASITAGSTSLTGGNFTSADIGRSVVIPNAGNKIYTVGIPPEAMLGMTHSPLTVTVISVANGTATLSKAAGRTVNGSTIQIYDRDKDITIRGGSWTYGNNAGGGDSNIRHVMFFRRVDGLTIAPDRTTSTVGKYHVAPGDCTDTDISIRSARSASAIVQLVGPMVRTRIHDVNGTSQDDSIAFGTGDYPTYMDVSGDIEDLTVENINCHNTGLGVVIHGFNVNEGDTIRSLTIDNIGGRTDTGYVIALEHFTMTGVQLSNIRTAMTVPGPAIQIGAGIDHLLVDGFTFNNGSAVRVVPGVSVGMLVVRNGSFTGSANSDMVYVNGTVDDLHVDNCRVTLSGSAYIVGLKAGSGVKRLRIGSCTSLGGGGAFDSPDGTTTLNFVNLNGLYIDTASWVGTISGTTTVRVSDVQQVNPQAGSFGLYATAVATIYADRCTMSTPSTSAPGYSLRVVGTGMPMDHTKVNAPQPGDVMYSTNGSVPPYDGVIVRGPTNWKNLYNGTTG